jgi:hypothetical protein
MPPILCTCEPWCQTGTLPEGKCLGNFPKHFPDREASLGKQQQVPQLPPLRHSVCTLSRQDAGKPKSTLGEGFPRGAVAQLRSCAPASLANPPSMRRRRNEVPSPYPTCRVRSVSLTRWDRASWHGARQGQRRRPPHLECQLAPTALGLLPRRRLSLHGPEKQPTSKGPTNALTWVCPFFPLQPLLPRSDTIPPGVLPRALQGPEVQPPLRGSGSLPGPGSQHRLHVSPWSIQAPGPHPVALFRIPQPSLNNSEARRGYCESQHPVHAYGLASSEPPAHDAVESTVASPAVAPTFGRFGLPLRLHRPLAAKDHGQNSTPASAGD